MATTWFAQNSSVNIDSANEWNDAANGSGNWLTWANLAADDVLCANGKTAILINCDFACARISTGAEVPIQGGSNGAAGGGFTFSGTTSRTITTDVWAGTSNCLLCSHTSCTLTIMAPAGSTYVIVGGSSSNNRGLYNNSSGSVAVTGNISGGSGTSSAGIYNANTGAVAIAGNVYGGSNETSYGMQNMSTGAITITGNVYGGTSSVRSHGVFNSVNGVVTITGNLINTLVTSAVAGSIRYTPGPTNYIQYPYSGTPGEDYKYPKQLAASNVKSGVAHGDITGTYEGEAGAAGGGPLVGLGGLVS